MSVFESLNGGLVEYSKFPFVEKGRMICAQGGGMGQD